MTFGQSIKTCFSKYASFSGRASVSEFWWFMLFLFIIGIVTLLINRYLNGLFLLATLLPSLAACIRRLHDTDRSGWWQLINLVPVIGAIVLIIWYIQPGTPGPNAYGDTPTEDNSASKIDLSK